MIDKSWKHELMLSFVCRQEPIEMWVCVCAHTIQNAHILLQFLALSMERTQKQQHHVDWLPRVVAPKHHRLGHLKQQIFIVSQCWRTEVLIQNVGSAVVHLILIRENCFHPLLQVLLQGSSHNPSFSFEQNYEHLRNKDFEQLIYFPFLAHSL